MKKPQIINRLSGFFDHGLEKAREMKGGVEETILTDTKIVADKARAGWEEGRKRVMTAEQLVLHRVKENPAPFILAGLSLLGLIAAKMLYDRLSRIEDFRPE